MFNLVGSGRGYLEGLNSRFSKKRCAKGQDGFSLAELVIVIIVIGFLGVIVARQFGGGTTDAAQASALKSVADKVESSWVLLTTSCGVALDPSDSNTIFETGDGDDSALNVLAVAGQNDIVDRYLNAYQRAGIKLIDDIRQEAPGEYFVYDYPISMEYITSSRPRRLEISYESVPVGVAEHVWSSFEREAFPDSGGSGDTGRINIEPGTSGVTGEYDITLIYTQ